MSTARQVNAQGLGPPNQRVPLVVPVRDVDNAARMAFHGTATVTIGDVFSQGTLTLSLPDGIQSNTVPAGKRAVIEAASVLGNLPAGQRFVQVNLQSGLNGTGSFYALDVRSKGLFSSSGVGIPDQESFQGSQLMRMYVDPGNTIVFNVQRNVKNGGSG